MAKMEKEKNDMEGVTFKPNLVSAKGSPRIKKVRVNEGYSSELQMKSKDYR